MAAELNLPAAAQHAYTNLEPFWVAGTLKAKLLAFATTTLASFSSTVPNNIPIANWCALIEALSTDMNGGALVEPMAIRTAARYVYGICYLGAQLQGQGNISGAQATVILNAYNANF